MTEDLIIKIYGADAKEITEGQVFTASIESVEGRTVVTLTSKKDPMVGTENDLIRKELLID